MTLLADLLDAEGYSERPQQTALYDHLVNAGRGVVAQAATGVGKSIAVLAAAAHARQNSIWPDPSIIVTPTRVLMDQYMAHDAPLAGKVFGMEVAELRGMSHYECAKTRAFYEMVGQYFGGCDGRDIGCTPEEWGDQGYECGYQEAKMAASVADIVVTNTDMWLVNDRLIEGKLFGLGGALFIDEAHQLEAKMRDFASRSLNAKRVKNFSRAGDAGPRLAKWIQSQPDDLYLRSARECPVDALVAIGRTKLDSDATKREREVRDAAQSILRQMADPNDSCLIYLKDEAIKMDWINIASSARATLEQRPFGLVSATVPRSMRSSLGISEAPFIDVGHPFIYSEQATLSLSSLPGDFRSRSRDNTKRRAQEVYDHVMAREGGALILFSAFRDMEEVYDELGSRFRNAGRLVLRQEPGVTDNDELGRQFKSDGHAVLFGSASFATGFDAPGSALETVVLWKLPYPGSDLVTNAIRDQSWPRYQDIMTVTAVQAIGRLIRRDTDTGHVHIADSRAERLLDARDPLTSHLVEFRRV